MANFPDYTEFVQEFLNAGYTCRVMHSGALPPNNVLFLRHDIDFDVEYALQMAKIEASLGVVSTYFFMLTSDSYTLLSAGNIKRVREIAQLGHKISLHFDPMVYTSFHEGLLHEVAMFQQFLGYNVDIISIHHPNDYFLSHNDDIHGISHTYQQKFVKDVFYCSDSRGGWRFGDPRQSKAFAEQQTIHMLIHPIWWIRPENDPQSQLDGYVFDRIHRMLYHIEDNCKSYEAHLSIHFSYQKA